MSYPPQDPNQPPQPYFPPAAPGYGPPPPGYPVQPPAPKKGKGKGKLIIGIVAGVLGLCCVGGVAVAAIGGDNAADTKTETKAAAASAAGETTATKAPATKATTAAPKKKPAPGIGDPVRDGKFEFTVTKLDCTKTKVGDQYLNKRAQGVYCQVSVTVRNIGKEAQLFDGSSQKALDAEGTEFSNDGAAELYANGDSATFLNEINPGNSAKGKLLFDVPKGTKLTVLELHDSPFSGGVLVTL